MQAGFNHNIRHEGVLFHVQTEDCGVQNPVVITHLFVGGNIVATRRSSYEKFVSKASLKEIVIAIMQEQHKEMMRDLVHSRIQSVQKYLGKPWTPRVAPEKAHVKPLNPSLRPPRHIPKASHSAPKPSHPPKDAPTLDTSKAADKTLDELILEFLTTENKK